MRTAAFNVHGLVSQSPFLGMVILFQLVSMMFSSIAGVARAGSTTEGTRFASNKL